MRKGVLQASLFVFLLSLSLYCAVSQKTAGGYSDLLRRYERAQNFYDKATALTGAKHYGPREEALEKEWNETALQAFTLLFRQTPAGLPLYDSLRFHTAFKIGELQHYFENFTEAVAYYRQAVSIKENGSLPDSLLFKPLLYAGIIFYNQNKFDTAIRFFKRAETVQNAYGNRLAEAERLYNILGVLHYERGNYRQAQNYFRKALSLLPRTNPYYNELFVNYKINLAQLHMRLEEYDKANEIYKDLLPRRINLNEIYHNIGTLNLSLGAAADALTFFKKVSYQNNKIVRLYNSIGQAFFNLPRYDSALAYYQKAVAAYASFGTNADPVGYGLVLKNLGDYHRHFENYPEALRHYQKAIHQFYPSFVSENVLENPDRFSGVFSYINLFNALNAKAEAWHALYLRSKKQSDAVEELRVYQSAFKLIDYVERTYDSDEARLFLTKTKHAVHGKPIDVAFSLYRQTGDKNYLSILYAFDQQNKAAVLALNRQMNASAEAASPLQQKERAVKEAITRLSIRAAQVNDSAQLAALNTSIRDREIELGKLQESLHADNALKEGSLPSVERLQTTLLDERTAIVSYHLAPDKLTTLLLTKTDVRCFQQTLPPDFNESVQQEILRLKTPSVKPEGPQNASLSALLLAQVPIEKLSQLIIIPDDVLAYLPFETLVTNNKRYLVERVAIQYQFSTALLGKNETDFSGAETLVFAPFAHQSYTDSLPVLPASAQEVAETKGVQVTDTAATKEKFLALSNGFRVVHLATHAVANSNSDNLSYVVFSPGRPGTDNLLYAREIYNLRLQKTGLVILSACETGAGNLVQGEGVLSLSRAFAYAGCPNIITSLWKADDFSTAYLTGRIHNYLDKGLTIARSVQQAKIDYLNDKTVNPRLKQPYYWSHLVFIGNFATEEKSFAWGWLTGGGLLLLLLLAVGLRRKKPGKARQ